MNRTNMFLFMCGTVVAFHLFGWLLGGAMEGSGTDPWVWGLLVFVATSVYYFMDDKLYDSWLDRAVILALGFGLGMILSDWDNFVSFIAEAFR